MEAPRVPLFIFPRWSNRAALGVLAALAALPAYVGALLVYGGNPTTLNVGYAPVQPVPYSHKLHVGQLGMDCRYCHNTVEAAGFAAIPPTDTCMNCHRTILANSPALAPIRQSYATGEPVTDPRSGQKGWLKVHDLPDYVYFNHAAHVNVGVGCNECHGQINHMDVVTTVSPLNMAWCLECHRDPAVRLRPRDQVTNMDWAPPKDRRALGGELMTKYHLRASTDCVTCHR